jgi:uroporphyrinogen-III decarboxylase
MFKPLHRAMNDWVHDNTKWKTFYHTCGSIAAFLNDFHEAGMDILNPVQISAEGMDPAFLKQKYGSSFVFWGGGVDSQGSLSFGTPDDVRKEVRENIETFKQGGGFVFNNVHNIQATVPVKNLVAFFKTHEKYGSY